MCQTSGLDAAKAGPRGRVATARCTAQNSPGDGVVQRPFLPTYAGMAPSAEALGLDWPPMSTSPLMMDWTVVPWMPLGSFQGSWVGKALGATEALAAAVLI